ncbi:hypothetical protein ATKI12_5653 [Kitasatospora sp. Ki12]
MVVSAPVRSRSFRGSLESSEARSTEPENPTGPPRRTNPRVTPPEPIRRDGGERP